MGKKQNVFFSNYDYTDEGPNETSPGGGLYHGPMDKYKSIKEFLSKRRKNNKIKNRKADWAKLFEMINNS